MSGILPQTSRDRIMGPPADQTGRDQQGQGRGEKRAFRRTAHGGEQQGGEMWEDPGEVREKQDGSEEDQELRDAVSDSGRGTLSTCHPTILASFPAIVPGDKEK
jgi:hypothetical protein